MTGQLGGASRRTTCGRGPVALFAAVRRRTAQLVRYCAVSAIATVTGMTVLGALVATHTTSPGWANVVAAAVGTVPSFELNRRWVWHRAGQRSLVREVVPFTAFAFVGLDLSTLLVWLAPPGPTVVTSAPSPARSRLKVPVWRHSVRCGSCSS